MSNKNQPQYKRGTIIKNGKRYGFYPDGSLYRIYSTTDRPFLEIVDIEGETFLRIRQATELGYTDCPVFGAADLNYPTSALRRSRTIGGVNWRMHSRLPAAIRLCLWNYKQKKKRFIEQKQDDNKVQFQG